MSVSETKLPEAFRERMKALLSDEYAEFEKSLLRDRVSGLRFNQLKGEPERAMARLETFGLKKIPWVSEGYYYIGDARPGKHPYHDAGVYYIQEPSAMAAVQLLDPRPGEKILDLCAAPGGKSTHIASRLKDRGFLLSNEVHPVRARILSQNMERMGTARAVVTNETPARLAARFPSWFDRVAVDAPCSGEGMFRKDDEARDQWSLENVSFCADRQQEILRCAAAMLKVGGRLVYSTCTFSPEENERSIERFLKAFPEFTVERVDAPTGISAGRPEWSAASLPELAGTFRIWPHLAEGEGHFFAVLKKNDGREASEMEPPSYLQDKGALSLFRDFSRDVISDMGGLEGRESFSLFGDQLYLVPEQMGDLRGLKTLRPGLHLGTVKKNRMEPSHSLALYLKPEQVSRVHGMDSESEEVRRYLRGESLAGDQGKGWVLMDVDGYSLGWSKLSGGILKNHYPKGIRRLSQ